jgi:hypothetical protein
MPLPGVERVCGLQTAEQLLIWGIRHWVECWRGQTATLPYLRQVFGLAGADVAAFHLDDLMVVLAHAPRGELDVRCQLCPGIGLDEARLLQAVAHAQLGDIDRGEAILSLMLRPGGARIGRWPVAALAQQLGAARQVLPIRRWLLDDVAAARPVSAPPPTTDAGLARIH